jgi:phosphonate transport system substrate-binding protein
MRVKTSTVRRALGAAVWWATGSVLMAQSAVAQPAPPPAPSATLPTLVDVRAGDTFSSIAARYTGDTRSWAKLYNAKLGGLPNANLIQVGMRLELVTEPGGTRYLRVVSDRANMAAAKASATEPAPSVAKAAPPAAPKAVATPAPAPAPAQTQSASPLPAVTLPAPDDTLVIGVLPNIGAAALMVQYDHLKGYLERTTKQKVRIVLPANFKAFVDSTMRGEFDVAVAAPHFARMAQVDRNMVPLVMYEPRINALFLSPVDSTLAGGRDVRGKTVAFANPQSLVALYGQQWLRSLGLEAGTDYQIKGANSDMGVGRMVLSGDAVAAIMSNGEFRALPPDEASRMKIVDSFARIPNFIMVAHPRLGAARLGALRTQLKQFIADKDEGAAFQKATGLTGIVDADDATLKELDPYLALTRRAMGY